MAIFEFENNGRRRLGFLNTHFSTADVWHHTKFLGDWSKRYWDIAL